MTSLIADICQFRRDLMSDLRFYFNRVRGRTWVYTPTAEEVDRLDVLTNRTLAPNRAEVLRRALGIYEFLFQKCSQGHGIVLTYNELMDMIFKPYE